MNVKKYFATVACILAVCLAVISGAMLAGRYIVPGEYTQPEGITPPTKDRANILVLGVDGDQVRTDTIILASLDNKNDKLYLLSIPRDTRVLDGSQYDKITHLYSQPEREEATIAAVKKITGIPIHYFVVINFDGLKSIMDAVGGVEIDVPNVPNKWSNGRRGMYYSDPVQNLEIALEEGVQVLDGDGCEQFLRFRYGYPNGDLGRIEAQQYFMKEVIKQKLQPQYILKAPEIFNQISKSIKTNYTLGDMASHLLTIKGLDSESVETFQLPGTPADADTRYGVLSCFIYDQEATDELMDTYFRENTIE